MSILTRILIAIFFSISALSCALGLTVAAKAEPSAEADFRMSCSSCHGEDGRGGGSKAFGLSVEPPDLTTLTARNGGVFPRERLRRIIDGREDIKLHVDREMPVWGELFKMDAEEGLGGAEGDNATVQKRIDSLIDFIGSLQR
jgi:hypothetical protein